MRGGVSHRGEKPKPLERRHPTPKEQVIYGHRGDFMQAKLYLKELDQHVVLRLAKRRVRMEVALKRWACIESVLTAVWTSSAFPFARVSPHTFGSSTAPRFEQHVTSVKQNVGREHCACSAHGRLPELPSSRSGTVPGRTS